MNAIFAVLIMLTSPASAEDFSVDAHKGKVVYLDFWASWCSPCKDSFPWLNAIHKKYKEKGLVVIGINVDKEKSKADEFLKKIPAEFQIVYNPDAALAKKYNVKGMPYAVILDKDGKVLHSHIGFRTTDIDSYVQTIEGALK